MTSDVAISLFASGVVLAAPIAWASLGEAINEKAGVINIGIEGVMLFGALSAAWGLQATGGYGAGFLVAAAIGALIGLLLSYLWVTRRVDQIISGIMFNLLALGLTTLIWAEALQAAGRVTKLRGLGIPLLSDIPLVGEILFKQNWAVYAVVVLSGAVLLGLRRSNFGLELRAVGENPHAAESSGVSVIRIRYVAVNLGCILSSIGGAVLVASTSGKYFPGMTNGRGFIALAVVVLGRWNPLLIMSGALLVGLSSALQFHAQAVGFLSSVPSELWLMLPYIVTIAAIVVARRSQYPAAFAIPYQPGESL